MFLYPRNPPLTFSCRNIFRTDSLEWGKTGRTGKVVHSCGSDVIDTPYLRGVCDLDGRRSGTWKVVSDLLYSKTKKMYWVKVYKKSRRVGLIVSLESTFSPVTSILVQFLCVPPRWHASTPASDFTGPAVGPLWFLTVCWPDTANSLIKTPLKCR